MEPIIVNVDGLGKPPSFSHAVVPGEFIYLSGTLGLKPNSMELVEGGAGPETTRTNYCRKGGSSTWSICGNGLYCRKMKDLNSNLTWRCKFCYHFAQ